MVTRSRRASALAATYFALSTAALVAPAYPLWGNHVEPRVLGLPWSLVSVLAVIASNLVVFAWLYVRRIVDDAEDAG